MNSKFSLLFSLIFLLVLGSCSREDAGIVITDINLDEDLSLAFRQTFDPNGSTGFLARLTTSTEYDCQDGKLRNNLIKTDQRSIIINIIGLDFPELSDCKSKDVASVDIDLGELPLNENHSIQISLLGEVRNTGSIINYSDRIVIHLAQDSESGLSLEDNLVYKIPSNVVWGFMDTESAFPDSLQSAFNNQIETMGSPMEKIGPFGHFDISSNGSATIYDYEKSAKGTDQVGFAIAFNDDFQDLVELVENQYCDYDFRIRIWDTAGNVYSCN